jgi:hypothetical protein
LDQFTETCAWLKPPDVQVPGERYGTAGMIVNPMLWTWIHLL